MNSHRKKHPSPIPINIITGFLGAGKTTAIKHLLGAKPDSENWAVLVNEFGEVGLDGRFLKRDGIAVREVPGGCICCSVSLPSTRALAELIDQVKPERILIEPTGLADPAQILTLLKQPELRRKLQVEAVICLVDPWCFSEPQFMAIPAFTQQLVLADVLVASKADSADTEHLALFEEFARAMRPAKQQVAVVAQGNLAAQWLALPHAFKVAEPASKVSNTAHPGPVLTPLHKDVGAPIFDAHGVFRQNNRNADADACGWLFSQNWQFQADRLTRLIKELEIPRIKGIFLTEQGWLAVNKMRQQVTVEPIGKEPFSRVEMIHLQPVEWRLIEQQLRQCRDDDRE